MRSPSRKEWVLLGGSTLLAFLLSALLAEVYFRRSETHLTRYRTEPNATPDNFRGFFAITNKGRRLLPNSHMEIANNGLSGLTVRVDINSQGFRHDEIPAGKAPGEVRVLALGDSITLARYLPQEATYAKQLEGRLNTSPIRRYRVINGGVDGIGTADEIDILEEQGLAVQPDIVLLQVYLNDSCPPDGFAALIANPGWLRRNSVFAATVYTRYQMRRYERGLSEDSGQYQWLRQGIQPDWISNRESLLRFAKAAGFDWGAAWNPEAWRVYDREFQRLQRLAAERRFKVVVVLFPVSFQVYARYLEDTPQRKMRALATRFGFSFFDTLPLFRANNDDPDLFYDWCHPRAAANEMIGDALAEHFQELE